MVTFQKHNFCCINWIGKRWNTLQSFFHFCPLTVTVPLPSLLRLEASSSTFLNVIDCYSPFLNVTSTWPTKLMFKLIFVGKSGSCWGNVKERWVTVDHVDERWPPNGNGNITKMKERLYSTFISRCVLMPWNGNMYLLIMTCKRKNSLNICMNFQNGH